MAQTKPYPLRMPDDLRSELEDRAKENGRSVNAEIVKILTEKINGVTNPDVRIIKIPPNIKRVIEGKLLKYLDVDFTQPLDDLKKDIDYSVESMKERNSLNLGLKYIIKRNATSIHQGANHLDIIEPNKGSMKWLTVKDIILHDESNENHVNFDAATYKESLKKHFLEIESIKLKLLNSVDDISRLEAIINTREDEFTDELRRHFASIILKMKEATGK